MPADSSAAVHLDANGVVAIGDSNTRLGVAAARWLADGVLLHVSALAWAEFQNGPPTGLPPGDDATARRLIAAIIPVGQAEAELAARLFNTTGRRSRSLPDCVIAASAILAGAPLATENTADFAPFLAHGLTLA